MKYIIEDINLSKDNVKTYESIHKGFKINKDKKLKVYFDDGSITTYLIFKGKFTKPYMCRDCEEYYEISLGNNIIKLDKEDIKS